VAAAVLDHNGHPVAAVAVTYPDDDRVDVAGTARVTVRTAAAIGTRLTGRR
jgi:DNA-binding IclR family transcriptional regulator